MNKKIIILAVAVLTGLTIAYGIEYLLGDYSFRNSFFCSLLILLLTGFGRCAIYLRYSN